MTAQIEQHHPVVRGERGGSIIVWPSMKRVYPLALKKSDIVVEDIAWSLSMMCRYAGHVKGFYSVAQHCCHVHDIVAYGDEFEDNAIEEEDVEDVKWALMHDAAEAYLQDMVRPLKYTHDFGSTYRAYESEAMGVICARFDLDPIEPDSVSAADRRLCITEQRDLRGVVKKRPKPYPWKVESWPQPMAFEQFMSRANALGIE
jgi:5'-deoxynucleotidase YfbR-like HD superfamily hydrolase